MSLSVEEATRKNEDLVALLSLGGFKLTKFASNVPCIQAMVQPKSNAPVKVKENPTTEVSSHVLGLKWNHFTNTLSVSRGTKPDVKPNVTQRVVLSLVSEVYGLIGLVAHHTVMARLFLKDIWKMSGQQFTTRRCHNVPRVELRASNPE